MKNDRAHAGGQRGRIGFRPFLGCVAAVLVLTVASLRAEDAAGRRDRYDGYIEALNAPSAMRARVVEAIYGELRGQHAREMHESLREALFRSNSLILQGAAEALAMLGDPGDIPVLEALLATSPGMEAKTTVIRLLPAFCLGHSERARFNYIRYAVGYDRVPDPSVLEPLRRPPLTRRGRLDFSLERMQKRIVRALAGQFDPVAAALRYIDDRVYGQAARRTVAHYTGNALGNDPGRWSALWGRQGRGIALSEPEEVIEIRMAILQSLSDMGAEGLPELTEALERLLEDGAAILGQAVFETLSAMCRSGFDNFVPLRQMQFGAEDAAEAENWRLMRFLSSAGLARFAADKAAAALDPAADPMLFGAAAECMGTALSYPEDFPDPAGELALARRRGVVLLARLLLQPGIHREQRGAVATALGEIGDAEAVEALAEIIGSPYCSPESGVEGNRMAESVIDALGVAASGGRDGRDAARAILLDLLRDRRMFEPVRSGTPPVGMAHMTLWRLQRLAKSTDTALDPELWRMRLGW